MSIPFSQLFKSVTLNGHAVFGAHPGHKMSRTMNAEEVMKEELTTITQHQPEEEQGIYAEMEQAKHMPDAEAEMKPEATFAVEPNVLKNHLSHAMGSLHLVVFQVPGLEKAMRAQLWNELGDMAMMLDQHIKEQFAAQAPQ